MIKWYNYEINKYYFQILVKKIVRIRIQGLPDPDSIAPLRCTKKRKLVILRKKRKKELFYRKTNFY